MHRRQYSHHSPMCTPRTPPSIIALDTMCRYCGPVTLGLVDAKRHAIRCHKCGASLVEKETQNA